MNCSKRWNGSTFFVTLGQCFKLTALFLYFCRCHYLGSQRILTLKKKRIVAIKKDEGKHFSVNRHTKVCSKHFSSGDFYKEAAVPSKFNFPTSRSAAQRKPPTKRHVHQPATHVPQDETVLQPDDSLQCTRPSIRYFRCGRTFNRVRANLL